MITRNVLAELDWAINGCRRESERLDRLFEADPYRFIEGRWKLQTPEETERLLRARYDEVMEKLSASSTEKSDVPADKLGAWLDELYWKPIFGNVGQPPNINFDTFTVDAGQRMRVLKGNNWVDEDGVIFFDGQLFVSSRQFRSGGLYPAGKDLLLYSPMPPARSRQFCSFVRVSNEPPAVDMPVPQPDPKALTKLEQLAVGNWTNAPKEMGYPRMINSMLKGWGRPPPGDVERIKKFERDYKAVTSLSLGADRSYQLEIFLSGKTYRREGQWRIDGTAVELKGTGSVLLHFDGPAIAQLRTLDNSFGKAPVMAMVGLWKPGAERVVAAAFDQPLSSLRIPGVEGHESDLPDWGRGEEGGQPVPGGDDDFVELMHKREDFIGSWATASPREVIESSGHYGKGPLSDEQIAEIAPMFSDWPEVTLRLHEEGKFDLRYKTKSGTEKAESGTWEKVGIKIKFNGVDASFWSTYAGKDYLNGTITALSTKRPIILKKAE